jgi:hypothetical protein
MGYSAKDPFLQKYRQREVTQNKLKVLTDAYDKQKAAVEGLGVGQEIAARRLAPLKAQIDATKGSLKVAQTDLETSFKGLGPKVQDALIANLANFTISVGGTLIDKDGMVHPATLNNNVGGGFREAFAGGANPAPGGGSSLLPKKNLFQVQPNRSPFDLNNSAFGNAYGSPGTKFSNLGGAISYEMANKPSGSNLVVANSSETVIPAAGGLGMGRLVESIFASARATGDVISQAAQQAGSTIMSGFGNLTNVTQQGDKSIVATQQSSTAKLQNSIAASTQAQLAGQQQLMTAIQQAGANGAGGLGGGGGGIFGAGAGGGGVAKVIAAGKMLQGMGLNVAENPAFGNGRVGGHAPNSYHYSGRAIDVTGPESQLDAAYAKLKGTNPAELLWRTAGHYDHLHLAYAFGLNNPALLNSKEAARNFEAKYMPTGAQVQTITANSSERLGGTTTVNAPITINQLPGQSTKELASAVVLELSNTIADIRNSSYNV